LKIPSVVVVQAFGHWAKISDGWAQVADNWA